VEDGSQKTTDGVEKASEEILKAPELTPAERDEEWQARDWLANVYQGDRVRQLSVRSIVTGMLIGAIMSVSNLYVGLKTGWGLGVTITACIIAYAVFRSLEAMSSRIRKDPFTILENYTMSSCASAAGYMSSSGLVSAIPALFLTEHRQLTWWEIMVWLSAISVLGVFMAVPLKRQLINIDKLPFPSGIATAETLRSMHTAGTSAVRKARSLFIAGIVGAVVAFWRDGLEPFFGWVGGLLGRPAVGAVGTAAALPSEIPFMPGSFGATLLKKYTLGFEGSLIMVAAGAIMGLRIGVSLLIGAIFYYGLLGPYLIDHGMATEGYRGIVGWILWPSTAMMVASGLLSFGLRWRMVVRSFSGLTALLRRRRTLNTDPLARIEVPGSWFVVGVLVSGLACVVLGEWLFHIPWWMGILAVALTFVLSLVAARATGETDITPIGAMGKITQLVFGVFPHNTMGTNLMTANITAGAASHSADLLTDLKSGHMLGGNPRKQTISQLFGVLAGTLLCAPVYLLVVKPETLGSESLPAPAAKVWASVAELMSKGFGALPNGALAAMAVGAAVGVVLTLLEEFLPKKYRVWVPSPTGLGIAGVIPAFNSVSMFLGSLFAWVLAKARPKVGDEYTVPVSSGLIAGESLMGVFIILVMEGPGMILTIYHTLFGR
jgi:uncharacterized oligopeptide transporter (OPT) family protein